MAAVVVDGSISSANWKKDKPKDYKGSALDTALAAYEKVAGKKVTIPASLPTMPKQSVKAFEDCIKDLESAAKDLKAAASHLKDLIKALDAVSTAGKSTEKELRKMCDDTNDKDKRKTYLNGASTAGAIGGQASETASKLK